MSNFGYSNPLCFLAVESRSKSFTLDGKALEKLALYRNRYRVKLEGLITNLVKTLNILPD